MGRGFGILTSFFVSKKGDHYTLDGNRVLLQGLDESRFIWEDDGLVVNSKKFEITKFIWIKA